MHLLLLGRYFQVSKPPNSSKSPRHLVASELAGPLCGDRIFRGGAPSLYHLRLIVFTF